MAGRSLVAALTFGLVLTAGTVGVAEGSEFRSCGSFEAQYHIEVVAKNLPCGKARRIEKEYWKGPDSRKTIVNGGSGCCGWILLDRFPGWKCFSGAGAGTCKKGRKVAGYEIPPPGRKPA